MNKAESILLWSANIWLFGDGLLGPLFAVFTQQIGGNILDITYAYAAYLIVTGVGVFFIGKISDRYNKTLFVSAGYGVSAIFTFGYLLVNTPLALLLVQVGLGIGLALSQATWHALYSVYESEESAGYIWGAADGWRFVLQGAALLVGGWIVSFYTFTALFVIMGTIQLIASVYQLTLYRKQLSNSLTPTR